MDFENSAAFAAQLDAQDELRSFREKFYFPLINGKEALYFTGNSLGLQPKTAQDAVLDEMEDWASFGVEGHLHAGNPWVSYHEQFPEFLSPIIGAEPSEIVVMNQLTVNLHVLFATFYRPTKQRYKILCEAKAFPSDQYALASQAALHGFDAADAIIEVFPREGNDLVNHDDIITAIQNNKDELAMVMIGGVNYYSGQVFNMKAITEAAHAAGAYCGFDLAHAAGNISLSMHDWGVDFAAWCSYKYLNSGPGGVGGVFIHKRHHGNKNLLRFAGWWGHDKDSRFKMEKEFTPIETAEGWQLSNAPVLAMAVHRASLSVFAEAGMENLVRKGQLLSDYLIYILNDTNTKAGARVLRIITPSARDEKGCQVSVVITENGKAIFEALKKQGVIADWREPNVIRLAPVPLYNSFSDIQQFGLLLTNLLTKETAD